MIKNQLSSIKKMSFLLIVALFVQILFEMMSEPVRREKLKNFNTLEDVAQHIKSATNILVLTGAGVSVR